MRPTLRENLTELRPVRRVLISIAVARSSVMLFPFYAAYLGVTNGRLSPASAGVVIGVFGAGALLADVVSGLVTKYVSERSIAVIGMVGVAVMVLAISVTSETPLLIAETTVWGFCYELINPVTYTLVAKTIPESSRRFAFAAVRLAINVGMGIGPVVAGVLFKINPNLLAWINAIGYFWAAGILATARLYNGDEQSAETQDTNVETRDRPRSELRFWSFFAVIFPIHLAYALVPTFISAYVVQRLAYPTYWVSAIFALNTVMIITCEIGVNQLMNHWQRRTMLLCGFACAAVGFGLMGFASTPWILMLATSIWTLGEMVIYPAMLDHVSAISPNPLRSRNMGLYYAGVNLGVLIAPPVILPLSAKLDPRMSWGLVAVLLVLGMIGIAALSSVKTIWNSHILPAATPVGGDPR